VGADSQPGNLRWPVLGASPLARIMTAEPQAL